jgi:hypothetical protein
MWGFSYSKESEKVPVAGFDTDTMQKGAPAGWELEKSKGFPDIKLEKEGEMFALHLKSNKSSSFGVKKEVANDPTQYPFLNWKWKVTKLPVGGDVRDKNKDDQALQLYVAFKATGWPAKLNTPVIGYIWDNEAPKGTVTKSPQPLADKVRYIVLRDKTDTLGEWYSEKRDVRDDYKKLFSDIDDGKVRKIEGISIYINSQHTGSEAESYIYGICFNNE